MPSTRKLKTLVIAVAVAVIIILYYSVSLNVTQQEVDPANIVRPYRAMPVTAKTNF